MKDDFKYFKLSDFNCRETGENEMDEAFGFPFYVTSGYRSPNHSIEKRKKVAGTHARGIAADIAVNGGRQRMQIVRHACALGFVGIGVAKGFVHVDVRDDFKPVLWCY